MGAMLGSVLSGNLIQMVFFWELTSLCSFLLIGYWHHSAQARDGARMALTVTSAGGLCLLAGALIVGHIVGSYDLDRVLASGEVIRSHRLYVPALVLVLLAAHVLPVALTARSGTSPWLVPTFWCLHIAIMFWGTLYRAHQRGDATSRFETFCVYGVAAFLIVIYPLLFTGEMMFPWMFEEIRSLRPFRAATEALARRESYPPLYDPIRLAANDVPVAAVVYHDDLYVDAGLSLETAAEVGNLTPWITNEFEHDGIRQSGNVFKRLVQIVKEQGGALTSPPGGA
jgi:hypothetical protein